MSCREEYRRSQLTANDKVDSDEELTDYQLMIFLFLVHCLLTIYLVIQAHYNYENIKLHFK